MQKKKIKIFAVLIVLIIALFSVYQVYNYVKMKEDKEKERIQQEEQMRKKEKDIAFSKSFNYSSINNGWSAMQKDKWTIIETDKGAYSNTLKEGVPGEWERGVILGHMYYNFEGNKFGYLRLIKYRKKDIGSIESYAAELKLIFSKMAETKSFEDSANKTFGEVLPAMRIAEEHNSWIASIEKDFEEYSDENNYGITLIVLDTGVELPPVFVLLAEREDCFVEIRYYGAELERYQYLTHNDLEKIYLNIDWESQDINKSN